MLHTLNYINTENTFEETIILWIFNDFSNLNFPKKIIHYNAKFLFLMWLIIIKFALAVDLVNCPICSFWLHG